jgi:hypothetical protein
MKSTIIFTAALISLTAPALAEDHTASWYAAHPADMNAVLNACRDDPGHLKNDPNCANADQGEYDKAAHDAEAAVQKQFADARAKLRQELASNPAKLLYQLKYCNNVRAFPGTWNAADCPAAFAMAKQYVATHKQQ